MSVTKMDPSCTVGFYIHDAKEFKKFVHEVKEVMMFNEMFYFGNVPIDIFFSSISLFVSISVHVTSEATGHLSFVYLWWRKSPRFKQPSLYRRKREGTCHTLPSWWERSKKKDIFSWLWRLCSALNSASVKLHPFINFHSLYCSKVENLYSWFTDGSQLALWYKYHPYL